MWMKLKSQLKLKQWFDITERENVVCFLWLLSLLSLVIPGLVLLLHSSLHRLCCSTVVSHREQYTDLLLEDFSIN